MMNKKNDIEPKIREKVEFTKNWLENRTVHIGNMSIRLTSTVIYLLCLLTAILIWFNVSESKVDIITREFGGVSIVVEGEGTLEKKNLAVFDGLQQVVTVTVEGSRTKVDKLSDDDIVAYIDVSDISETGTARLDVSIKGIGKLDAIASPSSIRVFVDEEGEIEVPISVNKTYSIVSNYDFNIRTDISTVNVVGAKSVLDTVDAARADADLGELTSSFSTTAGLVLTDDSGVVINSNYITPEVSRVVVYVDVYTEKTVPLAVSYKYGYIKDKNISVSVTPSVITLQGDPILLADIDKITLPAIDETKVTGDTIRVVSVNLPLGVTDVNSTETYTEEIKLKRMEKGKLSFDTSKIKVTNPNGIQFSFADKAIELEYMVASDSKNRVTSNNFTVGIDLTNYSREFDGNFEVSLTVTAEDTGYTLYPINIDKIAVDFGTEGK